MGVSVEVAVGVVVLVYEAMIAAVCAADSVVKAMPVRSALMVAGILSVGVGVQ